MILPSRRCLTFTFWQSDAYIDNSQRRSTLLEKPVRGHEKVSTGGQLRSPLVATKSPHWWPREVPALH